MADLWGYADLHCHPMAHLGYGGELGGPGGGSMIFGRPMGPLDQALPCCTHTHGLFSGGSMLPMFLDHAHAGDDGFPTFAGWPRHDTQIHQQMYVDWIKRAHHSGLRLMVATAVNNEHLAGLFCGPGTDVSDGPAIARQLDGIKAMVKANTAWMALATTPAEARLAVTAGKLAVVLGVEVDSVLGGAARRAGDYDQAAAQKRIDALHRIGVGMITPIHLADSAIGGCAMFDDRFALSGHHLHQIYRPSLPAREKWMRIDSAASEAELDGVAFLAGAQDDAASLIALYGRGFPDYRSVRRDGHVNVRGLSGGGQHFLKAMMRKGMMIDVDHMSMHTCDGALRLAEQMSYPLVCSHLRVRGVAVERPAGKDWVRGVADEGMRSDTQLRRLKALGSAVGIITHLGPVRGIGGSEAGGAPRTRSYDTSESWVKAYDHVVDRLGLSGVGLGTDFNGFYGQPGPRFAGATLSPLTDAGRPIRYGQDILPRAAKAIERALVGKRSFDHNVDGLAHYGMIPDFLVDVAIQRGGWDRVEPLFRSAEAVIELWQRCVDRRDDVPTA